MPPRQSGTCWQDIRCRQVRHTWDTTADLFGLEVSKSRWEIPPRVLENERAKILWDFQIQTGKLVMANQSDTVVVDKLQKKAVVIDVAVPSDSNIKKKEDKKLENNQGLK